MLHPPVSSLGKKGTKLGGLDWSRWFGREDVTAPRHVHANVPRHCNVRAAVRLAHHGNHGDPGRRPDRLALELWQESFPVSVWDGSYYIG